MKELREVTEKLRCLSRKHKPGKWKPESYIGKDKSRYKFLNLKVPHVRQAMKEGYSFSKRSFHDQYPIWQKIWFESDIFEVSLSALHFLNNANIDNLCSVRAEIIRWQSLVDNWAFSDDLSNCYSKLLEQDRKFMSPHFESWNKSSNPWDVRQSLVGLLFYSRFRSRVLSSSKILGFIRPHLSHEHYYVQKGVGWTLRESWNVYPIQTYKFMKQNAHKIPSAGWTAATEKLSMKDKAELSRLRKSKV